MMYESRELFWFWA